jgi:hypothetical protein
MLAAALRKLEIEAPIWIRNTARFSEIKNENFFQAFLLDASIHSGSLMCDGLAISSVWKQNLIRKGSCSIL